VGPRRSARVRTASVDDDLTRRWTSPQESVTKEAGCAWTEDTRANDRQKDPRHAPLHASRDGSSRRAMNTSTVWTRAHRPYPTPPLLPLYLATAAPE
jgi:hypothetical protein